MIHYLICNSNEDLGCRVIDLAIKTGCVVGFTQNIETEEGFLYKLCRFGVLGFWERKIIDDYGLNIVSEEIIGKDYKGGLYIVNLN